MKAARVHSYGGPQQLLFEDVTIPELRAGEVLVKVNACGVNPADAWFRSGQLSARFDRSRPFIPGWEIVGTVEALGPGSGELAIGLSVFGLLNFEADGGYAEYVAVEAARLRPTPTGLELAQAASLPLAGLTGVQMVEIALDVQRGQRVLIAGALGPVGRAALYAARLRGAVVVAGVRSARLQEAMALGASECLAIDDPASIAANSHPFDVVVDTIGPTGLAALYDSVKPGGKIVTVVPLPPADIGTRQLSITHLAVKPDPDRMLELAQDVLAGRFAMLPIQRLPLCDAAKAHVRMQERSGVRIVLCP